MLYYQFKRVRFDMRYTKRETPAFLSSPPFDIKAAVKHFELFLKSPARAGHDNDDDGPSAATTQKPKGKPKAAAKKVALLNNSNKN